MQEVAFAHDADNVAAPVNNRPPYRTAPGADAWRCGRAGGIGDMTASR